MDCHLIFQELYLHIQVPFLAVFFLWLVYAIWLNSKNTFILSNQVGELFGGIPGWSVIILGALVAGMLSGLAGWTGSAIRESSVT